MKKLSWLIMTMIMMSTFTAPANAQAALLVLLFGEKVASENFYFSLKVGGNLANVTGIDDTNMKLGLNFGLLATIKLSDKFSLVPEFAPLSQKGAKDIPYLPSGNSEVDDVIAPPDASSMDLNYIDIPIIAQYNVTDQLSIGTGPQFGILTSSNNTYEKNLPDDDQLKYSQDSQVSWNTFDAGWAFEAVFSLGNARKGKGINIHGRYVLGLTDIIKDNSGDAVRNSVFQFFISLPFMALPEEEGS